jgi:hypothetical protein
MINAQYARDGRNIRKNGMQTWTKSWLRVNVDAGAFSVSARCPISSSWRAESMEEDRETLRFILPRTTDSVELLKERRREVDREDGRRDEMVGVSMVELLWSRGWPER